MRRDVPDEERCEAKAGGYGYTDRCQNRAHHERDGYRLCTTHQKRYDAGHAVRIAGDWSRTGWGHHVETKDTIQKTFEDEEQRRYKQVGLYCSEVHVDRDKVEWNEAEPDKGLVLCNILSSIESSRARVERRYREEMAELERREKSINEQLERWKNGEPEPDERCRGCFVPMELNEERQRGTCNKCQEKAQADAVLCKECDELCVSARERKFELCDICYDEIEDL